MGVYLKTVVGDPKAFGGKIFGTRTVNDKETWSEPEVPRCTEETTIFNDTSYWLDMLLTLCWHKFS